MGIAVRMLFGLCVVVAPIVVWTTSAQLPARVASHFARGGYANGFMPHDITLVRRSESQAVITGINENELVALSNPDEQVKSAAGPQSAMKALSK